MFLKEEGSLKAARRGPKCQLSACDWCHFEGKTARKTSFFFGRGVTPTFKWSPVEPTFLKKNGAEGALKDANRHSIISNPTVWDRTCTLRTVHVKSVYFTDLLTPISYCRLSVEVSCSIERILASHEVESIVLAFYESFILEWDEETQRR